MEWDRTILLLLVHLTINANDKINRYRYNKAHSSVDGINPRLDSVAPCPAIQKLANITFTSNKSLTDSVVLW